MTSNNSLNQPVVCNLSIQHKRDSAVNKQSEIDEIENIFKAFKKDNINTKFKKLEGPKTNNRKSVISLMSNVAKKTVNQMIKITKTNSNSKINSKGLILFNKRKNSDER